MSKFVYWIDKVCMKYIGGHITIGRLTIFGYNAMHFAVNYERKRGDWVCFALPSYCFGKLWPAHFYISPDGTPDDATFCIPKSYKENL